jgi:four helix bundle protein
VIGLNTQPDTVAMEDKQQSKQEELRARTKRFALRIIRLFRRLPRSPDAQVLGKQLLRSGTSVGANYRSAGRARSEAEFSARIGIVLEEADETVFWLECLSDAGIVKKELLDDLLKKANELVAIFAASYRTSRQ